MVLVVVSSSLVIHPCHFKTIGGFTGDAERDIAMTNISDEDIAWIKVGGERSGTAQNLMRRITNNIN